MQSVLGATSARTPTNPSANSTWNRILEAGWRSPSGMNIQPWDFVVCTDREQLADLARVWQGAGHVARSAATIAVVSPRPDAGGSDAMLQYDLGPGDDEHDAGGNGPRHR